MNVTFILKDGNQKFCEFADGQTVLKVAEKNGIKLNSNCEGFGVCGGCHVKIENLLDKLPEITEHEEDTLDRVSGVSMNSRLACQLVLSSDLDGLVIKIV